MSEFHHYTEINQVFVSNYGDRYCHGEAISTVFMESTVNQVISRQVELSAVLADAPLRRLFPKVHRWRFQTWPPRPGRAGLSEE